MPKIINNIFMLFFSVLKISSVSMSQLFEYDFFESPCIHYAFSLHRLSQCHHNIMNQPEENSSLNSSYNGKENFLILPKYDNRLKLF